MGAIEDSFKDYLMLDGYLFSGKRLCIPKGFMSKTLVHELHGGSLGRHFD